MYLVCIFKDNGQLFITTRKSRDTMVSVLLDMGQEIESRVEKEFDTYAEAMKYIKNINDVDDKLDKIL